MKYKICNNHNNNNLVGGTVPKINSTKSTVSKDLSDKNNKIEHMNISGPLYFNLEKNPIVSDPDNISFYEYNYEFPRDNPMYLIDSNLNLNKRANLVSEFEKQIKRKKAEQSKIRTRLLKNTTEINSRFKPVNRIIIVNGLNIPYYLGKFHTDKRLFGRLKLLFELYVKSNFDSTNYVEYKSKTKAISLIDSLFVIGLDAQRKYELININKKLENPIDKYIFISKFYELIEILTWECPINSISSTEPIQFVNIPVEERTKKNSELQNIIKKEDFTGLIKYYNNKTNNYQIKFFKKFIDEDTFLSPKEKINYIRMLCLLDFIISKLNLLFTLDVGSNPDKINLANLQDLYQTYKTIFSYETNPSFNDNLKICKNIEAINKTNMKNTQDKELSELILNEVTELVNFYQALKIIKNTGNELSLDIENVDLGMIFVLSYFDLRIQNFQITMGKYLDALPLNKVKIYTDLFGKNRSIESTDPSLINTENFINKYGYGPKIIQTSPTVRFPDLDIDFPVCVEHSILQFVKFLFWDDDKKKYDINYLELPSDNFLRKFMEVYIKTDNESEEIIKRFVRPLIKLKHIDYVSPERETKKYYELNATPDNFVRILLLLLRTSETDIMSSPHVSKDKLDSNIEKINKILGKIDMKISIVKTNEFIHDVNLFKIIEEQDILILKINLANDAHGGASKPSLVDPELVDSNIKNFVSYLLLGSDIEGYEIYTRNYFPALIDYKNFNADTDISSKYFNVDNIYWLNFIDFENIYIKNQIEPQLLPSFNVKFIGIINQIIFTPNSKNILIVNNKIKWVIDYMRILSGISPIDNPSLYSQLSTYLLSKPNILDWEFMYNGKTLNLIQHVAFLANYSNLNSFIVFNNTFKQIDESKLYNYIDISNRPINIFIQNYLSDFTYIDLPFGISSTESFGIIIRSLQSIIDLGQRVLYDANGDDKRKLPLNILLANIDSFIRQLNYKISVQGTDKSILTQTIITELTNVLTDKDKRVLEFA